MKKLPRETVECACGCGATFVDKDESGRVRKFISGHNSQKYTGNEAGRWAAQRRYRNNNPDKLREYKREYYRSRKLKAMKLLGNYCFHCGLEYNGTNAPVFEFHHVDPEFKETGITRMLINKRWADTLKELVKCELLCRNCHMQHHGGIW